MSEAYMLSTALALIAIIVVILNYASGIGDKKRRTRYLDYLEKVRAHSDIDITHRFELLHQLVVCDSTARKLLVIEKDGPLLKHIIYRHGDIGCARVKQVSQSVTVDGRPSEHITIQIGVTIETTDATIPGSFIVFYDHAEHKLFLKTQAEQAARKLVARINETMTDQG